MAKCSNCAKRRGLRTSRNNSTVRQAQIEKGARQLTADDFTGMFYVGPDQTLASVVKGLSYGRRVFGQHMLVHNLDLEAEPDYWVDSLPEPEVSFDNIDETE